VGTVDTIFWKIGSKEIRGAADGNNGAIGRWKKKKRGQQNSPMVKRAQLYRWASKSTNRPMVNRRIGHWMKDQMATREGGE
jgi:hypothetical protein